jgi:di/tricarboxylate transporter
MVSLIQIFSLFLLVVTFAVAIWRHMNIGMATIAASFILMLAAKVPAAKVYTSFPSSLVILMLGVTFLFGHAQRSGAIDRIINWAVRMTGRRDWALPWIMFLLAASLSAIGVLPAASLAITIPVAMRTAQLRGISPVLMGTVTISGGMGGGFSPLSVWSQLLTSTVEQAHRSISASALFGLEISLNLLVAIVAFIVFGGIRLFRAASSAPQAADMPKGCSPEDEARGANATAGNAFPRESGGGTAVAVRDTAPAQTTQAADGKRLYQIVSVLAIVVFVTSVLVFSSVDVGLLAFGLATVIQLIIRPDEKEVIRSLPWGVVLTVAGVLLYVGLLENIGTFASIADHLGGIGNQALTFLAISLAGALFATLEPSAVAVLGLFIALALRTAPGMHGTVLLLFVSQFSWAIVCVSTSPYHLSGGLVIATTPENQQQVLFRKLLVWTIALVLAVPTVGWIMPLLSSA